MNNRKDIIKAILKCRKRGHHRYALKSHLKHNKICLDCGTIPIVKVPDKQF